MQPRSRYAGPWVVTVLLAGGALTGLAGCADSLFSDEPPASSETENEAPVRTDHDHAVTGTGTALTFGSATPRLDASSFDAFQISCDKVARALDAERRAAFKNALDRIMMLQYQVDPDLSFDVQWRKQYGHLDGMTAEEVIEKMNSGQRISARPTGTERSTDAAAMRTALLAALKELRADLARYHELRGGEHPDLARSWSDLTAPIAVDGIPAGPLRRHPAVNPFTKDPRFASTVTDDRSEVGAKTAWFYDRASGTIKAVVSYDDAMRADLVVGKFMPGDATEDIVTYE